MKSQKRIDFETHWKAQLHELAVDELSALNMEEMLEALDGLAVAERSAVVKAAEKVFVTDRHWDGAYDRIRFAYDAVDHGRIQRPPSLTDDAQVRQAKLFVFRKRGMPNEVTNHSGMSVDLFAELLGRSASQQNRERYWQALSPENNDTTDPSNWGSTLKNQPLKQNTHPESYNCGDVTQMIFGTSSVSLTYVTAYYERAINDRLVDLKMNGPRLQGGIQKIRQLLTTQKKAVRVFVVHHDGFSFPVIRNTPQTHFLTIVGFGANDTFLYIDPWPGGSRLTYTSGIFGDTNSAFMGILSLVGGKLKNTTTGAHHYVVIAGP